MTGAEVVEKYNRTGICNYKKCKAACCRFAMIYAGNSFTGSRSYWEGHGFTLEILNGKGYWIKESPCNHLDLKTYECKINEAKPPVCDQFPTPDDSVFERVQDVCSYRFKDKEKIIKMC